MLATADLHPGDGAQVLQDRVGVPQLQRIGGLRVSGHSPLWQQQVQHHAEIVRSTADFRQSRQEHRQSPNGAATEESNQVDPEIGYPLVVRTNLFDSGVQVATDIAVVESSRHSGIGQRTQRSFTG